MQRNTGLHISFQNKDSPAIKYITWSFIVTDTKLCCVQLNIGEVSQDYSVLDDCYCKETVHDICQDRHKLGIKTLDLTTGLSKTGADSNGINKLNGVFCEHVSLCP